jgi:hypothetical protein
MGGFSIVAHLVPFQRSANGPLVPVTLRSPTTTQAEGVAHDTPPTDVLCRAPGADLIVHFRPSQCSINKVWSDEEPTATQRLAAAHDTSAKNPPSAPAGVGDGRTDHVEPFQRCTNVLPLAAPTAKQLVAVGHDTEYR